MGCRAPSHNSITPGWGDRASWGACPSTRPTPPTGCSAASERGNPRTRLDDAHPAGEAWSEGNLVRPLIHGATYFAELLRAPRGDPRGRPGALHRLAGRRRRAADRATRAARSPRCWPARTSAGSTYAGWSGARTGTSSASPPSENRQLGQDLQERGAEALLDMRVRTGGSHHQKFVVIRHRDDPARDIAFVGGIDLCHSRRDDADHLGDPQAQTMADGVRRHAALARHPGRDHRPGRPRRGDGVPGALGGPDPAQPQPGLRAPRTGCAGIDLSPDPLPAQAPPPPPVDGGTHVVQLLRTYPDLRRGRDYPFARGGERSVARGYTKALSRARRLIYVEDQYLWGHHVGDVFADALRDNPDLRVIAVVPLFPDLDGASPAAAAARPAARDARDDAGRPGPGRGLRHREPRRHPGLRARQGLRHRRHLGDASAPTTSTAAPGRTTPSCPRWWSSGATRGRAVRPRPAAHPGRRAPRPARRPGDCWRR